MTSGLRPPELSTVILSQIRPRSWVTSAIWDSGRCSSPRIQGLIQNVTLTSEMPTASAAMVLGKIASVMRKRSKAHNRLE